MRCQVKLIHFTEENSFYFVTSTTYRKRTLFSNDNCVQILCHIIYNLRNRGKMLILGFVIMPEHFHLLMTPRNGVRISWIMQEIKKGSARLINNEPFCRAQGRARLQGFKMNTPLRRESWHSGSSQTTNRLKSKKVWMDEYYDYVIRDEKDLIKHLNYIHNNPVKRGLVENPDKYFWSSANSVFENDLEKI